MLVISQIVENFESYCKALEKRNINIKPQLNELLNLDNKRRQTQSKLDDLLSESNLLAKKIGDYFKNGEIEKASKLKDKASSIKPKSKVLSERLSGIIKQLNSILLDIPNIPHDLVPNGSSEKDNIEIFKFTDGELDTLKVRKIRGAKNLTNYSLGNNDKGNFLRVWRKPRS